MKYGDSVERYKRFRQSKDDDGMTVVCMEGCVRRYHEFLILPVCTGGSESLARYGVFGVRYYLGFIPVHTGLAHFEDVYEARKYVDFLLGGGNNA